MQLPKAFRKCTSKTKSDAKYRSGPAHPSSIRPPPCVRNGRGDKKRSVARGWGSSRASFAADYTHVYVAFLSVSVHSVVVQVVLSDTGRRYDRRYSLALHWDLAAKLLHNPRGPHELRQVDTKP